MLLLSIVVIQTLSWVSHASESEFLPVEEAFPLKVTLQKNSESHDTVHVSWEIADHYYLYKSRIKASQDGEALPIIYEQESIEKHDEYFGKVEIFKHALNIEISANNNSPIALSFQGCAEAGLCYPPVKKVIDASSLTATLSEGFESDEKAAEKASADSKQQLNIDSSDTSSITALLEEGSMVIQLLIFFALGLGLAFTPCVFPMIPILSSIIVGQGENLTTRRAFAMSLSYVLAMAVTYAIAGVVVGYFGATANIQLYLQSPWVLGTFALVFVLLSLSMFGLYELALPRFIQDKLTNAQQQQQGGSLVSVAIMGALSALVVSPCVSAPLAGTLVYISTTGDALLGGLALLALGLGMGVPLLIIGTGGGKFLPKAGMWMDGVKNVFGVALLAIAIWLLERVVPASVTLALWGTLLIGSGTFLGAFEQGTQGWKRLFKAVGLLFSLYGALLMVGAAAGQNNPLTPLKFLGATPANHGNSAAGKQGAEHIRITTSEEFEYLLAQGEKENKVVVLDFYADWCIACKVMEAEVFSQPSAGQAMKDVIFVQLDMTDNTENQLLFLKGFNLFGPPAVLFFSAQQELTELRVVGDLSLPFFLETLEQAKSNLKS